MLRIAPAWLSGYAGVILLMAFLLNLAVLLARFSFGLILPFMEDDLGLSHFQSGSLFATASIVGMIAAVVVGVLASRYGSRFIIAATAMLTGVATILLGMSPNYLFAVVMSGIIGFASMGCIAPVMGLLSVWFESANRGTVAGLAAGGAGISFVVVGVLVPWLTGRDPEDGWRHTWFFLGALIIVAAVLSMVFVRDRPRPPAHSPGSLSAWPVATYRNPMVWMMALLAFFSGWVEGLYLTFFGVYLDEQEVGVAVSGRLWILLGLLGIAGGIFWGGLSDRLGRRLGFLLSFVVVGAGCFLFWLAPVMAGFLGSVVLFGLSFRASYTICAAAAGDYAAPHFSAATFGLMGMGAGFGSAVGPLVGGRVADVTDAVGWVFVLAAGGAAVAIVASVFLRRPDVSYAKVSYE